MRQLKQPECPPATALQKQFLHCLVLLSLAGVRSAAHLGGDGSTKGSAEHILIKLLLMSPSGLKFLLLVFHSVKCFANQSKGRDMKS